MVSVHKHNSVIDVVDIESLVIVELPSLENSLVKKALSKFNFSFTIALDDKAKWLNDTTTYT